MKWFFDPWFGAGSNLLQYIGSIGLIGAFWHYWHHRCSSALCVRPGSVPVKGTVHNVCKKHAMKHGHTH